MISSPVRVYPVPAIAFKSVAAFGADFGSFRHAQKSTPSLNRFAILWKTKLHTTTGKSMSKLKFDLRETFLTVGVVALMLAMLALLYFR